MFSQDLFKFSVCRFRIDVYFATKAVLFAISLVIFRTLSSMQFVASRRDFPRNLSCVLQRRRRHFIWIQLPRNHCQSTSLIQKLGDPNAQSLWTLYFRNSNSLGFLFSITFCILLRELRFRDVCQWRILHFVVRHLLSLVHFSTHHFSSFISIYSTHTRQ